MIKILFLAANPVDTFPLNLREELEVVLRKMRASSGADVTEIRPLFDATVDDLERELRKYRPHIVHFSGHGSPSGIRLPNTGGDALAREMRKPSKSAANHGAMNPPAAIDLPGMSGEAGPVPIVALAELFELHKKDIRCVLLNACHSIHSAQAVAQVIDCAIGMQAPIFDTSATLFAGSFYQALTFGDSLQKAFAHGVNRIKLSGASDFAVPQLVCRPGVKPEDLKLTAPLRVHFLVSTASADRERFDEFLTFLKPMQRSGVLHWQTPEDLELAVDPQQAASDSRNSAHLILLLLSQKLLASDDIQEELPLLLDRHEKRQTRIVPIALSPCRNLPPRLAKIIKLPRNSPSISESRSADSAWAAIVDDLEKIIEATRKTLANHTPPS